MIHSIHSFINSLGSHEVKGHAHFLNMPTQNLLKKLLKLLKIKIGAKVMLIVNVDIQDCLINDQTGNIKHIEIAHGNARKVNVKFSDEEARLQVNENILFRQT